MDGQEEKRIRSEFADAVNMTATELKDWLGTAQSRSVGDSGGQGESTGHRMGRTITELLGTKAADLDDADLQKMRKVTATYTATWPNAPRATSPTPRGATR